MRSTIEKVPNKLYIAHLELLLISEKAASEDILNTIDFFLRDNEGGNNFMIVISKDYTPQNILSKLSAINPDPAKAICDSIKATYEYEGASTDYLLYDTLDMILNKKRTVVVASISLDNHEDDKDNKKEDEKTQENSSQDKPSEPQDKGSTKNNDSGGGSSSNEEQASTNNFKVTELAYFEDGKLKGYLEKNDALIYNLLQNRLKSSVLSIGDDKELIALEVTNAKAKLKPKFENDNFVIDIDVSVEGNITETGKNIRENMNNNYKDYISKIEDIIKGKIEDAVDNYKYKYKEDIVGFEDFIYKKLNKKYKEVESDFKEKYFENISVNVKVKVEFPLEGGDMIDGTSI